MFCYPMGAESAQDNIWSMQQATVLVVMKETQHQASNINGQNLSLLSIRKLWDRNNCTERNMLQDVSPVLNISIAEAKTMTPDYSALPNRGHM